jgi:ATPase subunit of ABC transporter with duplicated ATPase domains
MKAIEDIDPDLDADDIIDDEAEDDESDDDDDDEAELMRELQKIKAERAAEAAERVSILLIPFSPNHSPRLLSVHSGEERMHLALQHFLIAQVFGEPGAHTSTPPPPLCDF